MAEESIGTARIDIIANTETAEAQIKALERGVSQFGQGAADQYNKASTSAKRYADSLTRQVDMLGKTRAEQIAFNAQARIGGELGDAIAKKAIARNAELAASTVNVGKTARELNFAMRGLPAQITDIGVSLASGQRPMMVFLQQGGQLKDMFGGIGPAARALGGALLGLINPLTLSAAAVGGLLFAWKQGSDEAVAFNKALITTGNFAGVTADKLHDMSASMARTGVTQHAAAAALAEVASSGKFTGEQLRLVGTAALAMSTMTGQATAETIKQFEGIAEKPVEAILKLNDAQHFLTASIYEQIKALDDQGRSQEAASLAMQTYSNALDDRRAEVVENAGLIEKAWASVASSAKFAWDAMLGVGRDITDSDRLDELRAQLVSASQVRLGQPQPLARFNAKTGSFESTGAGAMFGHDPIQDIINKFNALQVKVRAAEKVASDKAAQQRLVQDQADSDRQAAAYFTNAEKRAREYLKAENEFNARIKRARDAGNAKLAEQQEAQKKAVLAGINAKYADKGSAPRAPRAIADPMAQLNSLADRAITQNAGGLSGDAQARILQQQVTQLQAIAKAGAEAITKGADLAEVQAKVAIATDAVNQHFRAEADQLRQKDVDAVNAYKASLQDMLETRKAQIAFQARSIGMGQQEARQQAELFAIQEDYNRKRASLVRQQQNTTSALTKKFYQEQIDALDQFNRDSVQATRDGWEARAKAQADAINGMNAAIQDFLDEQANAAAQTYRFTQDFIGGFGDAFADFATGAKSAKDAFGDFADSLYREAMRLLANKAIAALLGGLFDPTGGAGTASYNALGGVTHIGFGGGLANGGPVMPGSFHEVNEHGPELYTQGGKTYLMGGSRQGNVVPIRGGGGNTYVTNVNVQPTSTRRTAEQVAVEVNRTQRLATARNG